MIMANRLVTPADIMPFPGQLTTPDEVTQAATSDRLVQVVFPFWLCGVYGIDDQAVRARPRGGETGSLRDIVSQIEGSPLSPRLMQEWPEEPEDTEPGQRLIHVATEPLGILAVGDAVKEDPRETRLQVGQTPLHLRNPRNGHTQFFALEDLNIPPANKIRTGLTDPYAYLRTARPSPMTPLQCSTAF